MVTLLSGTGRRISHLATQYSSRRSGIRAEPAVISRITVTSFLFAATVGLVCHERTIMSGTCTFCDSSIPSRESDLAKFSNDKMNSSVPSWTQRLLYRLRLADLPIPRRLTASDPVFSYSALKYGNRQRARDESKLRSLQKEAIEARRSGDIEKINAIFKKISSIAYGQKVTPQDREDFVVRYGCTGWTDDILQYLINTGLSKGYVEIGAGNGQWARAIQDRYKEVTSAESDKNIFKSKEVDFVIPYDDYSELPLSPEIYHRHTQPFRDYFHSNVRKCKNQMEAIRQRESRGRILLLVFPLPGPFALETVKAYVDIEGNDTVVYVGEGRGGVNANKEFFDYICSSGWILEKIMTPKRSPGGKVYELLFVLRRSKKSLSTTNES